MKRCLTGALTLALIVGVTCSALADNAGNYFTTDYNQIVDRFDITALIFEPAQPDGMKAILRDMHLTTLADDADGNGQYVLDFAGSKDVLSVLQKYGKIERQLHQRGPLGDDGRASAFSQRPERQFSVSLKTRFIPSVNQLPPAFIMDYSLKSSLERPLSGGAVADDSTRLRYTSGGSVLLPDKGALMSVRETGSGYLIWIIRAN